MSTKRLNTKTITFADSPYNVLETDELLLIDSTLGDIDINLFQINDNIEYELRLSFVLGGINDIRVFPFAGDSISGGVQTLYSAEVFNKTAVFKSSGPNLWSFENKNSLTFWPGNQYNTDSGTNVTVGYGNKVFIIQGQLDWREGMYVRAISDADNTVYMEGRVVSYIGNSLTVDVRNASNIGASASDWIISFGSGDNMSRGLYDDGVLPVMISDVGTFIVQPASKITYKVYYNTIVINIFFQVQVTSGSPGYFEFEGPSGVTIDSAGDAGNANAVGYAYNITDGTTFPVLYTVSGGTNRIRIDQIGPPATFLSGRTYFFYGQITCQVINDYKPAVYND